MRQRHLVTSPNAAVFFCSRGSVGKRKKRLDRWRVPACGDRRDFALSNPASQGSFCGCCFCNLLHGAFLKTPTPQVCHKIKALPLSQTHRPAHRPAPDLKRLKPRCFVDFLALREPTYPCFGVPIHNVSGCPARCGLCGANVAIYGGPLPEC